MAKETKAKVLCTSCPMCYLHLKENSKDLDVLELSQLFECRKCEIKNKKSKEKK